MMCEKCKIKKATSMIRTHNVCKCCFNKLKKDNHQRISEGKRISTKLFLLEEEELLSEHKKNITRFKINESKEKILN